MLTLLHVVCFGLILLGRWCCCKVRYLRFRRLISALAADSCWRRCAIWAALGSRLTTGLFLMFLARFAYLRVFMLSSRFTSAGLTHAIMTVRLLPPRESCSSNNASGCWIKRFNLGLRTQNVVPSYFNKVIPLGLFSAPAFLPRHSFAE